MKKLLAIFLSAAMLLALIGCADQGEEAPAEGNTPSTGVESGEDTIPDGWVEVDSFQIAAVNHMTGSTALTGTLRENGYELAKEEINAAGGVNGLPIEIVYEDDQGTNTGAVSATQKVLSEYESVALMIDRSTMVTAVSDVVADAGIPTLFGATATSIEDLENPWFFRIRVADDGNAQIMAKFLVDNLHKEKIAALYAADTFGEGGNTETKAALDEMYGMTPVTEQRYTSGTRDFTAQLLAIQSAGADVVYAWGTNSEDNAIILRQFKQLGLDQTMDFIGSAAYASAVTIELAGENCDGIYSVYDFSPDDSREELQTWYQSYVDTYDSEPDFWCLSTYDGIKLVADAATRAGIVKQIGDAFYMPDLETARSMLAEALRETSGFAGAAGEYTCDVNQNMIHNLAIVQIKDGALTLVDSVSLDIEK